MIDHAMIEAVKLKLINTFNPHALYLFGSYAWGTPTENSDLDILIVVDKLIGTRHKMLVQGHLALARLRLSKDLLLYSKAKFEELAQDSYSLCYEVKHKGLAIYTKV